MGEVTGILTAIEQGDGQAAAQLLPLIYDELRKLAAAKLAREASGQILDATALVHEAYVRLVDSKKIRRWTSRAHFFAAAAEAMRRILIDNARRKKRPKHGGDRRRIDLEDMHSLAESRAHDLEALDAALRKFAEEDPIKARLVELRFFAGLTMKNAADSLGISRATADRYWTYAKVWLYCELEETAKPAGQ